MQESDDLIVPDRRRANPGDPACRRVGAQIIPYLEGLLEEARDLREHLDACLDCNDAFRHALLARTRFERERRLAGADLLGGTAQELRAGSSEGARMPPHARKHELGPWSSLRRPP